MGEKGVNCVVVCAGELCQPGGGSESAHSENGPWPPAGLSAAGNLATSSVGLCWDPRGPSSGLGTGKERWSEKQGLISESGRLSENSTTVPKHPCVSGSV